MPPRAVGEGLGDRSGYGFSVPERIAVGRPLRIKPVEGQFGKHDQRRAGVGRGVDGVETALNVARFIWRCVLLHERDLHPLDLIATRSSRLAPRVTPLPSDARTDARAP